MRSDGKTIVDIDCFEARQLLMKQESFCTVNLPSYVDFSGVLQKAEEYSPCYQSQKVQQADISLREDACTLKELYDGANYLVLQNKDGLMSWRPMELINPLIYAALVDEFTQDANWDLVRRCFADFHAIGRIECCSLPSASDENPDGANVQQWWDKFEQQSIAYSLKYPFMAKTDISDCYGSIYTHTVTWALHGKEVGKKRSSNGVLGGRIDSLLQDMHSRQTSGIPQGSVISDLIAEIILGYADLRLNEEIERNPSMKNADFQILRYRDDYRIFGTSREIIHRVLLKLMEVLADLRLKLSSAKTSISDDVVMDSVKSDKLEWLSRRFRGGSVHKQLLVLSRFSRDFPQSGTLVRELQRLSKRLDHQGGDLEHLDVLVAQVVDIIVRNPRCYPVGARLLSQILIEEPVNVRNKQLKNIASRFRSVPNSGLFEIWLQRIAQVGGVSLEYDDPLCQLIERACVDHSVIVNPWDWRWLRSPLREEFENITILNHEVLASIAPIISSDEARELFPYSALTA